MATTERNEEIENLFNNYKRLENKFDYDSFTSGNIPVGCKRAITRAFNKFYNKALECGYDMVSQIPNCMKPNN